MLLLEHGGIKFLLLKVIWIIWIWINFNKFLISNMPHLETHVQWIVEFLGSHSSGLALHSDSVWAISKPSMDDEDTKEYFQPMRTLLPQIRSVMRIGIDKITFVLSTIASFTVKTSNLVKKKFKSLILL